MSIETRKIKANEYEASRRIGQYAFSMWSDEMELREPTPDELNNNLAVFVDGTMAARLTNHSYEQIVRGVWRSASGIGGVATLPEYRRQGHIRRLFDATFADMRAKQQAVSVLFPFSHAFYGKFGYVRTNPILRVRFGSDALSHLVPLTDAAGSTWRYERVPAIDAVEPYKEFLHQTAAQPNRSHSYNGYMRDPNFDAGDCANQQMIFVKESLAHRSERVVAAALYSLDKYASEEGATLINDAHWIDASARDRLLAFFALHAAGLPRVQIHLPSQTNFHSWLSDSAVPYEAHLTYLPIMVRVMDVVQVLNGMPVAATDTGKSIRFMVRDEVCPWIGGTFEVANNNGVLTAQRMDGESGITMSIKGLTALAYGTLSVQEIIHRGWITAADQIEILESWFPESSIFSLLGF